MDHPSFFFLSGEPGGSGIEVVNKFGSNCLGFQLKMGGLTLRAQKQKLARSSLILLTGFGDLEGYPTVHEYFLSDLANQVLWGNFKGVNTMKAVFFSDNEGLATIIIIRRVWT